MVTGFFFASFQPQVFLWFFVQTCSVGGFLWWICVVWVFFWVRNALINYKIQALIHESVLFSMDSRGDLWKLPRWCELVPQSTRYMSTTWHRVQRAPKNPNPMAEMPENFPRNLSLTKTWRFLWRFFVNKRCQMFFLGNLQGIWRRLVNRWSRILRIAQSRCAICFTTRDTDIEPGSA